jgi:pimeloyl-ACP methyl ester carboxylesterase
VDDVTEVWPGGDLRRPTLHGLDTAALGRREPTAAVVLLHGGKAASREPVRRGNLAALRMAYFGRALRSGVPLPPTLPVLALRYRYRGWNAPDGADPDPGTPPDPVADTLWALGAVERRLGPIPIVLVGHSLGGRTAIRAAGYPTVTAVAALAPWLPEGEPVAPLHGRTLLIVHGRQDRVTSAKLALAFARRSAEVSAETRLELVDDGHAMLRAAGTWHRLVGEFVRENAERGR